MKVFVAGEPIDVESGLVRKYVNNHRKTASKYDLKAGTYDEVSERLIKSTRVFSSRISKAECDWFIERALTAPWNPQPVLVEVRAPGSRTVRVARVVLHSEVRGGTRVPHPE